MNRIESKPKDLEIVEGWLAIARENNNKLAIQIIENLFPELSSEDEIFRELIYNLIVSNDYTPSSKEIFSIYGKTKEDCLAWLEKQAKKESVEQDTEINDLWVYIREWVDKFGRLPKDEDELTGCIDYVMKRQKPTEWSEEDEELNSAILYMQGMLEGAAECENIDDIKEFNKIISWLKSLKPQKHWKPSDEQMEALETAIECRTMPWEQLGTLYNDLKNI